MKGDFSRWRAPNAAAQGYAGVLMQQGRLHTDSDWNENLSILTSRSETALADIIGPCGTPKNAPGFAITQGAGGFSIGTGRYYIDGLLLENHADTSFDAQSGADLVFASVADILDNGQEGLVYLEATKAHVTAQEDPLLADPALGGVDTTTRIKAQWRVGLRPIDLNDAEREDLIAHARCGHMPAIDELASGTGRMRAGTVPEAELPEDADCLIPPEAGYLSQENQLYRIQIVTGGTRSAARFVWSRENGMVQALLARNADGAFILRGDREDEAVGFVSGGWVEVFDDHNTTQGTTGQMTRITLVDGIATFAPNVANFDTLVNPRVRRWDHSSGGPSRLPLTSGFFVLEHGVQVAFTAGTYNEGDFWMFEARAATGSVIWPQITGDGENEAIAPMGWGRHYAPLALVRRNGARLAPITDLRAMIPSLTCLQAEDVRFNDDLCNMGADTVQEALEVLCQRSSHGLCTFVVGSARELIATVAKIPQGQSARICLRGAQFQLPRPVVFDGLGHITVEGTGPQSVVSVADGEAAFLFRDCATVRVSDMSLGGGRTGTEPRGLREGRLGAVTAVNCGDVSVERVRLRCRAGLDRAAACVSTRNTTRRARVLVRDCTMSIGQAQIGVNIIGATDAVVENNLMRPSFARAGRVTDRIMADPVLVAQMSRGLLWFTDSTPTNLGSVSILPPLPDPAGNGGEVRALRSFRPASNRQSFALNGDRAAVTASVHSNVSARLASAFRLNRAGAIAQPTEMRAHLRNVMAEAIRGSGRARVGNATRRIFDLQILALPDQPFIGQGIVVAGDQVDNVRITGNRIENAVDGIRVAASGNDDPVPPNWRRVRPPNTVQRASVTDNRISLQPVSAVTSAYGIYFGHIDRITAQGNVITGQDAFPNDFAPHFGLHQYGYRGDHLTWSDNSATDLHFGFAVLPALTENLFGIWRLRDNSAFDTTNAYAVAAGVQVI